MLLEVISKDGRPQGKCLAKRCEDCAFYRQWQLADPVTQAPRVERKCSFESIFFNLPSIIGSIDGCQRAANEARNRALETREAVYHFGQAAVKLIDRMAGEPQKQIEETSSDAHSPL